MFANNKKTRQMNRRYIFHYNSTQGSITEIIYKRLISREWFTYADVMCDYGIESDKISSSKYYNTLKKSFAKVFKAVREKEGREAIRAEGNNRNKRYRYEGKSSDPLAEERKSKIINNFKTYYEFCQDSVGFLPSSWLDEFFNGYIDLLEFKKGKSNKEQIMQSSIDRQLSNIELLPKLYKAIKNKQPLSITYKPFDEVEQQLTFHPHFLKEYNGRWYLLGHAEGRKPQLGYNLAIDRITTHPQNINKKDKQYIAAPTGYYNEFYKHIVGVTHIENAQPTKIRLRAHTHYIYKLTDTKPIHTSQKVEQEFGKHIDGQYGEFSLNVEINKELLGRILMMGADLEIMEPKSVREQMKEIVDKLSETYSKP